MGGMIKVLLMMDPRRPGYANLSGVHKYFYELVTSMPADVEFVFVHPYVPDAATVKHAPTKGHPGPDAKKGLGRFLPLWLRLALGYSKDVVQLARKLRPFRDKVDVFHVVAGGCEISTIAAKLARFPVVVDTVQAMHGEEAGAEHWVRRWVERLCFWCSDYQIFVSDATRESWEQRLSRGFPQSCTIYNGMRAPDFSEYDRVAYRKQFVADEENAFVIGICARLHHMKGHRVLIDAFAEMFKTRRHEDTKGEGGRGGGSREWRVESGESTTDRIAAGQNEHTQSLQSSVFSLQSVVSTLQPSTFNLQSFLLIAGDGPERVAIERQIAGLPRVVADRIRLVGHREDPCLFVACLDLHVMASTSIETIGYANIEAMFAGIPCIVSDVGGAKEIVRGSGGGVVVGAGHVEELVESMTIYAKDPERCRLDGRKGSAYACNHLTAEVMARKTLVVYEESRG